MLLYRRSIPVPRVVALSLALLLSAGLCEFVFRLMPMSTSQDRLERSLAYVASAFTRHRLDPRDLDVRSREGNEVVTRCRRGYRDAGFDPEKPEGQLRIFVVGGSFVYDAHAKLDRHWPKLLEERLRGHGLKDTRVINGGIPGHDSFESVARVIAEIHLFDPDVVLMCNSWNDIKYFRNLSPARTELQARRPRTRTTHEEIPPLLKLLERSQLYLRLSSLPHFFRRREMGLEGAIRDVTLEENFNDWGPQQFRLNVANFVDVCRNAGCTPVICTQPRLVRLDNSEAEREMIGYLRVELTHEALFRAFESCDVSIRNVAKEKSAPVLELAARVPGDLIHFADHVHTTEEGSRKIAEAAAELLLPILEQIR